MTSLRVSSPPSPVRRECSLQRLPPLLPSPRLVTSSSMQVCSPVGPGRLSSCLPVASLQERVDGSVGLDPDVRHPAGITALALARVTSLVSTTGGHPAESSPFFFASPLDGRPCDLPVAKHGSHVTPRHGHPEKRPVSADVAPDKSRRSARVVCSCVFPVPETERVHLIAFGDRVARTGSAFSDHLGISPAESFPRARLHMPLPAREHSHPGRGGARSRGRRGSGQGRGHGRHLRTVVQTRRVPAGQHVRAPSSLDRFATARWGFFSI